MKRKLPKTMAACFDAIERNMLRGPWVMGDAYTICDPYLFTMSKWLERDGVDIADFPKISAHFQRMLERPSVAKVLEAQKA